MTPLTFTVPGPPVPWMRAGSRNGQRFTPPRQRQYQRLVRDVAATAMRVQGPGRFAGVVSSVAGKTAHVIVSTGTAPIALEMRGTVTPGDLVMYANPTTATRVLRAETWPLDRRYSVTLVAAFGDARKRDIDNVQKTVGDALQGVAWKDDSQIDEWHVKRAHGAPRLDVTITVLEAK